MEERNIQEHCNCNEINDNALKKEKMHFNKIIEAWEDKYSTQEKINKEIINKHNTLLTEKNKELRDLYEENAKLKIAIERLLGVLADTNKNINCFVFSKDCDGDEIEIDKSKEEWKNWAFSLNAEFEK